VKGTSKTLITKLLKIMKAKGQKLREKYWVSCSHTTTKHLQTTKFQDLQFVSNEKKKSNLMSIGQPISYN
jgi:hypothetical protein